MEILKELKEKYNNLNKERSILYEKIVELEQQELNNSFAIGNCYANSYCDSFKKIIAMDKERLTCIVVDEDNISKDFYYLNDTRRWKKITSEQFKDAYLAVLKDIQNPDLENKESNFNAVLKTIYDSINVNQYEQKSS